uniref:ATP-grasp domain-containing protein n=1 Tax=viral metagenome TaxID=1070528 RepID=A0A6C0L4T1_9ZZZZ|tara:strand:+ start:16278 stop:17324 length:1047 start_codon:yes stop_codon:yes gene_type:complete
MRIGFIVGKDDEFYDDDSLYDITPQKYYQNGGIHTDVAVAMTIKKGYPDVTVDIILPNQITLARLKKNDVNFVLGYDCINQMVGDPYVRKFAGQKGYDLLKGIYSKKQSKIFPPIEFLEFIWSKDKYLSVLNKKKVPITPTITVTGNSYQKLLGAVQRKGWKDFIIKPVGGTVAIGVERFCSKQCMKDPILLQKYFDEHKDYYDKFLIQEAIQGFNKYGEIKMYWINEEYSYAVNTPAGSGTDYDDYVIKLVKDKKILEACKGIGEQTLKCLPKIKVGGKTIKPVLVRTDFTCCKENKKHHPNNYFLNEIEHQDAGSYVNSDEIKYPYVQVMADAFVKKAHELVTAGF